MSVTNRRVVVRQVRSQIGQMKEKKATLRALGLGKIGHSCEHQLTPSIVGMVKSVSHLVTLDEVKK